MWAKMITSHNFHYVTKRNPIKYATINHWSVCIQFNNSTVRGGSGLRDKIKNSTWNGKCNVQQKKKYQHKDRNIVHLLTMNIKNSFLGSIQNIFLYKRINNNMKVMRIVLLKRVPLSVMFPTAWWSKILARILQSCFYNMNGGVVLPERTVEFKKHW